MILADSAETILPILRPNLVSTVLGAPVTLVICASNSLLSPWVKVDPPAPVATDLADSPLSQNPD